MSIFSSPLLASYAVYARNDSTEKYAYGNVKLYDRILLTVVNYPGNCNTVNILQLRTGVLLFTGLNVVKMHNSGGAEYLQSFCTFLLFNIQ